MPAPSYSNGTVSLANGSANLVGTGTAWSTQVKPGDVVIHVPVAAAPAIVGFVDTVVGDLAITLADSFNGVALTDEPYRIVRGYSWWTGATPNETLVQFLTELGPLGLAGAGSGPPNPTTGRENQLYVDYTNRVIYQRRSGTWHEVSTIAQTFNPGGPWDGGVPRTALAISVGNVAIDEDDGPKFDLTFDGDFELQLPTDVTVGDIFDVLFIASGGPHTPSFAAGFSGVAASTIRTADTERTRLRFTVDAETAGTATAVTVAAVTFALNDLVEDQSYVFVSNIAANGAEPQFSAGVPVSDANWTWFPTPTVELVLNQLGVHQITISTNNPSGGQDGDLWLKVV